MENSEDRIKRGETSTGGDSHQRQSHNRSQKMTHPTGIVPSADRSMSVVDETLLADQLMNVNAVSPPQAILSDGGIIKSMLRFKWMILIIFVLVVAPSIAFIWTQIAPKYQARAEIRVRPIIPYLVFRTEDSGKIPFYNSFLNTQVSILRSLTVLQRVLDQPEVQETQWYKNPDQSLAQRLLGNQPDSHMERLRNELSVKPRRRTEIINVRFTDSSSKDAKLIVDKVLDQYLRYTKDKSDETKDKLYRQLVDQYKSLENEILGREKVCAELRRFMGTEIPEQLISDKRSRLDMTQARLTELGQSIAVSEWEIQQSLINDSNRMPAVSTGGMMKQPEYYEDSEWRKQSIDVMTVEHKVANSLLTLSHPDMIRMKKDLEFVEELLRLRESQLDEQWRNRAKGASEALMTMASVSGPANEEDLISLEYQLARARYMEKLLLADFGKQEAEFGKLIESAQLLDKENNTLLHKRGLFATVQQRLDQKNMERNVPGSIELLTKAFVSSRPYNDRRISFTVIAIILGLSVSGGAAFLRAGRNQTIYAAEDMPHPMQVPFLGHIPVTCSRKTLDDEVSPAMAESFRFVRTALLSRLDGRNSTTGLITSASEGTGKSTFTMLLGKSLAQTGKKVLMIDADLQKTTLSRRFKLDDKPGFIQFLHHRSSIDENMIFPTETSGLSIVPAGKQNGNGAVFEEIANGAFKACIGELRKRYDIILIDSPPILAMADATILSSQVDGTIMVERELVSQRANVINALARLSSAGGRLLGTVFIGSESQEKYGNGYHYNMNSEL